MNDIGRRRGLRKLSLKICHKITESNMDWNSTWPILNSGFNYQLEHTQCSPVECTNVKYMYRCMYMYFVSTIKPLLYSLSSLSLFSSFFVHLKSLFYLFLELLTSNCSSFLASVLHFFTLSMIRYFPTSFKILCILQ
jgi:hypothetical protein